MEAWRRVEVAACEEMEGPTEADLEAIRGATFTVEAVKERERVTDHDVAAFVDVLQRERRAGRALDPLRADLLRRARHGAGAAAAGGRRDRAWRARASSSPRWPRGRASTSTPSASGAPTASTPSRRPSASSSRASPSRRTATPSACERAFAQASVGRDQRRGRHLLGHVARSSRSACWRASASSARRCRRRSSRATATPSCCRRSRWPAPGLERLATEIRHLQRTEVREAEEPFRAGSRRARARCPTSATRSPPSASPGWRACCAATPRPPSRTSPSGTSATSRTRAPSA